MAGAKILAADGVDLLDMSGGMTAISVQGRNYAGYFKDMVAPVKAAVDVPVMLTGGIWSGEKAEEFLQEGAADLIGVGRAMLADHRWAEKQMQ